jgi:pimeloyl-ACP methyl ester carboxylesterase
MAEADVVIAWAHGGIPESVHSAFTRPTKFINLPNPESDKWSEALAPYGYPSPVRAMVAKFAPGTQPKRVALLGFSASCSAVAQVLASADGGRVDSVLAIDGIHTGYSDKVKHVVNANGMKPWFEFGKYAVVNERLFVDSHSSVVPPDYASTTETADWLWNTLTASSPAFVEPKLPDLSVPPTTVHVSAGPATGPDRTVDYPVAPYQPPRRAGGLIILGCDNNDKPRGTADHIYQAKVMLPLALTRLLAPRWNDMDPNNPGQSCYVG